MNASEVTIKLAESDEDEVNVEAHWDGAKIGCALSDRTGDRLHIADIRVDDEALPSRPSSYRRLFAFVRRPKPISFRRQGIGTRLLTTLLREADAAGIREIWGCVREADIDRNPALLEWYERHGFQITEANVECGGNFVKKIVRLRPGTT